MCGGPEHAKPSTSSEAMNNDADGSFNSLLELAANDDVDGFNQLIGHDPSAIDEIGLWYGRKKGCSQMVMQHRTPLMVAATYGSIEVLSLILSISGADVNRCCGEDKTTALHCAAAGGSVNAVDAVTVLLSAGADLNVLDANGHRPADVIVVSPKLADVKVVLEELLGKSGVDKSYPSLRVFTGKMNVNTNPAEDGGLPESPYSNSTSSAIISTSFALPEKKEYPIDPLLPDINNSIYSTDEFRMFSFKVRPCSRAYSHDWTECPFVHPGENARRRDPRKYHYSCVPCPDFRKGACRRGDLCEYAHGVFESWLHPAQYRTRLCKDGTSCNRRVCFFAHTNEELRPLYMSTGSASPSSLSAVMSPFSPPVSPSANGPSHSALNWPQPNVPMLHLPGSNLQSSRLRLSLSARDMPDYEAQQLINDFCLSRLGSTSAGGNRGARSMTLTPSNLDDLFSSESSLSPRYNNSEQGAIFSPSHKTAILNQFQQQHQSLLSPINTSSVFSPNYFETQQQLHGHNTLLQASLGMSSPARVSPRSVEPISPLSSRLAALSQREKQHQTLRSLSSRDLGSNAASAFPGSSISSSMSKWGSPSGTLDWGVNGEELGQLRRSSSFELCVGEEPDLAWVQSLVKDSQPELKPVISAAPSMAPTKSVAEEASASSEALSSNSQMDDQAAAFGAWLEQLRLDQMVR